MQAESNFGLGVLTVSVEQRPAMPGIEKDAWGHGHVFRVLDLSSNTQLFSSRSTFPDASSYLLSSYTSQVI